MKRRIDIRSLILFTGLFMCSSLFFMNCSQQFKAMSQLNGNSSTGSSESPPSARTGQIFRAGTPNICFGIAQGTPPEKLVAADCDQGAQQLLFTPNVDGTYQISLQGQSSLCLDSKNIQMSPQTILQPCTQDVSTQSWVVGMGVSDSYVICSTDAQYCLSNTGQLNDPVELVSINAKSLLQNFSIVDYALPNPGKMPQMNFPSTAPTGLAQIGAGAFWYNPVLTLTPNGIGQYAGLKTLGLGGLRMGGTDYVKADKQTLGSTSPFDALILQAYQNGVRVPLLIFEWDGTLAGDPPGYNVMYQVGQLYATRYQPNSAWLISQGIHDWGVVSYEALNEPDIRVGISLTGYHDSIKGVADGIHSVNTSLHVLPGGYGLCGTSLDSNVGGYAKAIADLFNSGALDGIDIHIYYSHQYFPIEAGDRLFSAQSCYDRVLQSAGITTQPNFYQTEFAYGRGLVDGTQTGMSEEYAAKALLAGIWDNFGVVKADGKTPAAKFVEVWNVGMTLADAQPGYALATQLAPIWQPNPRGAVIGLVMWLTRNLNFDVSNQRMDPKGRGEFALTGSGTMANTKLYVWQNWKNWTNHFGTSYTVPSTVGAQTIKVYGWDGLRRTQDIVDANSWVIRGLAPNETYMFYVE